MSAALPVASASPPIFHPELKEIMVDDIVASSTNPRKYYDKDELNELAKSIGDKGVLEPILVRTSVLKNKPWEIIAGERRWKAAKIAGLESIPAIIRVMTDEEVLDTQITENLMRADVHPLDEADGYAHLMEISKLDIVEVAARVSKSLSYVTRRLQLQKLIPSAQKDYRKGHLSLGHALEIARYDPKVQVELLKGCYQESRTSGQRGPDKSKPVAVTELQDWIKKNIELDLKQAPWDLNDKTLVPEQGSCTDCQYRTGYNAALFPDAVKEDICTNPVGYKRKMKAFLDQRFNEVLVADGKEPQAISTMSYIPYGDEEPPKGTLLRNQYQRVEGKKCEFTQTGLVVHGVKVDKKGVGDTVPICFDKKCKDHLGKYAIGSSSKPAKDDPTHLAEFRKRKQEIFDLRVADPVRLKVFAEALPTFKTPVTRDWRNKIAAEFYVRIPGSDADVIQKVFGKEVPDFKRDIDKTLKVMEGFSDLELARFVTLCAFAHYGANPGLHHPVPQDEVKALAEERGVNYKLLDAQTRLELSPKKYKAAHEQYLTDVTAGKDVKPPKVYDTKQKAVTSATKKKAGKKAAAKKGAKKGRK